MFGLRVASATVLFLVLTSAASVAGGVGIGINYLWWKLDPVSAKQCKADGSPLNAGRWFLPSYQHPAVRRSVVAQLRAMRTAGFTTLRVLVFFDRTTAASADSFTSLDGSVTAADRAKLRTFIEDVAAAGYRQLELVPSFQGENWLYCRNRAWGDCFDAGRTGENWRFIEATARTATSAAGPMPVRFDLANEAAPDPSMPARTLANARRYLQTIATRFQREFGSQWTISAARSGASAAYETGIRLELLLADLSEANLVPKYLEMHTYADDGNDVRLSLDEANAIATRAGAELILGELAYHSAVQADAIRGWLERTPRSRLVDVIQWPEYEASPVCTLDPVPPYTPGPFRVVPHR